MRPLVLLAVVVVLAGCQWLAFRAEAQSYPDETWSPTPLPPDPVLAGAAPELCGRDVDVAREDLDVAVQAQHSSHRAAFILTTADGIVDCIVSRPTESEPVSDPGSSYGSADVGFFEGESDLFLVGESAGPPASRAYGRAGRGIATVRVHTTNSGIVVASMGDGWFLAMWPGVGQVVSVEGLDASGSIVETIPGFGAGWDGEDWANATPYPTLPSQISGAMAAAVEAAEPFATELSRTPAELTTAFPVELADYCDAAACPRLGGAGWGVVFEITAPDGGLAPVLVILDAKRNLVLTQQ